MADLDKDLSLKIAVNANEATEAISELIAKLGTLDGSLNLKNLGEFVSQLNEIVTATNGLKDVAGNIDAISRAGSKIASLTGFKTLNDQMRDSEAAARRLAEEVGKAWQFDAVKGGKKNIEELGNWINSAMKAAARTGDTSVIRDEAKAWGDVIAESSNSVMDITAESEAFADLAAWAKKTDLHITDAMRANLKYADSLGLVKSAFRSVTTNSPKGTQIEDFAEDLQKFGFQNANSDPQGTILAVAEAVNQYNRAIENAVISGRSQIVTGLASEQDFQEAGRKLASNVEKSFGKVFSETGTKKDLFGSLLPSLTELQGIDLPDFNGLAVLAQALNTLQHVNPEKIKEIAASVKLFGGSLTINMNGMNGVATVTDNIAKTAPAIKETANAMGQVADGMSKVAANSANMANSGDIQQTKENIADLTNGVKNCADATQKVTDNMQSVKNAVSGNEVRETAEAFGEVGESVQTSGKEVDQLTYKLRDTLETINASRKTMSAMRNDPSAFDPEQYEVATNKLKEANGIWEKFVDSITKPVKMVAPDSLSQEMDQLTTKIDEIKQKMSDMKKGNTGWDVTEYKNLESQLARLTGRYDEIIGKTKKPVRLFDTDEVSQEAREITLRIEEIKQKLSDMDNGVELFNAGDYKALTSELSELSARYDEIIGKEKKQKGSKESVKSGNIDLLASLVALGHELQTVANALDKLGDAGISLLKKVFLPLDIAFKGFKEKVTGMITAVKNMRTSMQKHLDKMSAFWKRTMKTFTFMLVRKAITAILNETKNAVDSLARWSNQFGTAFNTSMSEITADASYLARNLVAMFEPVINAIVPILNTLVEALARAARAVAEFFAAFTGQSYFMVAKKKVGNYAAELDKANKKQKQLTMGIDELNILNEGDSGSGSDKGAGFGDEWDTAPVSDKMKNLADEIKKILEKLFEPLKKAWDIAGDYVLGGFKYMKEEIGKLLASIGKDFLEVWNQPETVKMLTNLLYILGDIEYTIGNLANGFREAWEEGEKGKKIFEAIRDILAILIQHVRNVTLYMRGWSQNIDFNPLLEKALELLQKMSVVAEFVGGVFEDIMKNVVLKYIEFLIEEGIPHLLDTIGQIIDSFDFEKLRGQLVPLEQSFEGMLENIDTGITNAIGNVGKAVGEFTQTEDFQKFLDNVQWFMDQITADRVDKLFTALGLAITNIAEALVKFVGSDQFKDFMQKLLDWFDSKSPEEIADGIDKIAMAIAGFKFAGFLGKGVGSFVSFLSVLSSMKNLGTIATQLGAIGTSGTAAGAGAAAAGAGGTTAAGGFGAMAASIAPVAAAIGILVLATKSFIDSFGGVEGALARLKTLFDDVGKVISYVAEEFKISEHIEHLKETIGRLLGSLGNMKDFWEVILNVLKWVADAVAVVLVPAFDILVKTIDLVISIIGRIIDNLGALGSIIVGIFEGDFNKVLENVERFVDNFLGLFKDLKYWLIGDPIVYDIVDGVVGGFKEMVTNVINAIKGFVNKIVQFFKDLWSKIVERVTKIKDDVVARWNALQEGVKAIVSILVTWVIGKWNELKQSVEEKVRLLKESIIQKWQEIKSNVEEKIRLLKDYIVQKWQEIRDKAEELWNKIKEKIITPIQEAWNKLFGTDGLIATTVTKAKAAWDQIKEDVETVLVKVKDAIIAPFKDAWNALFGENGWITGLVKKVKSAFDDISGDEITKMLKGVGDAIVAPFKDAYNAAMGEDGWVTKLLKGIDDFFNGIKKAIEDSPLGKFFENIADKIKGLKEKLDGLKSDAKEAEQSTRTSSTQGYFNGGIVQYATGGYPSRGTLFWAGEYGLPEMIGTVGGRTAVASSAEITGIRESVMESSIAEQNMMGQMINLLQAIAAKDLSVNMDSRELVSSLNDRARRNGYNFQMA